MQNETCGVHFCDDTRFALLRKSIKDCVGFPPSASWETRARYVLIQDFGRQRQSVSHGQGLGLVCEREQGKETGVDDRGGSKTPPDALLRQTKRGNGSPDSRQ